MKNETTKDSPKKHLLLLHGALGHSNQFEPYLKYLEGHFYVHTPLFPGHGGLPVLREGILIDKLVNQLHEYLQEKEIKQAYVFGYSMGGYVALAYALKFPGRLLSILTLATKLNWTEETASKEIKMLNPELIKEKVPHFAAELSELHGFDQWGNLLYEIKKMMLDLGLNPISAERFAEIKIPVQLMVGDQDKMVSIEETSSMSKVIPNAGLAVLPQTKHPFEKVRVNLLMGLMKDFWKIN